MPFKSVMSIPVTTLDPVWFRYHDIFNLIALPIVCITNITYLVDTASERYFYLQYFCFVVYVLTDTLWLIMKPNSVSSAATILPHHFICLVGWNITLINKSLARWISLAVLVEINTFFLIARRNVRENKFIAFCFYFTWILIRCIIYPSIFVIIIMNYIEEYKKNFIILNSSCLALVLGFCLVYLNFKWTVDLYRKSIRDPTQVINHSL